MPNVPYTSLPACDTSTPGGWPPLVRAGRHCQLRWLPAAHDGSSAVVMVRKAQLASTPPRAWRPSLRVQLWLLGALQLLLSCTGGIASQKEANWQRASSSHIPGQWYASSGSWQQP